MYKKLCEPEEKVNTWRGRKGSVPVAKTTLITEDESRAGGSMRSISAMSQSASKTNGRNTRNKLMDTNGNISFYGQRSPSVQQN